MKVATARISCLIAIGVVLISVLACGPTDPLIEIREQHAAGNFEATIEPLRQLLDADSKNPELNRLYGTALLAIGRPSLAVWPLQRASEDPEYAVLAGIQLAAAQLQSSSVNDAAASAGRVLELEPDNLPALTLRARALLAGRQSVR